MSDDQIFAVKVLEEGGGYGTPAFFDENTQAALPMITNNKTLIEMMAVKMANEYPGCKIVVWEFTRTDVVVVQEGGAIRPRPNDRVIRG